MLMPNLPIAGLVKHVKWLAWTAENRFYSFIFLPPVQGRTLVIAVLYLDPDCTQIGQRRKKNLKQNFGVRRQHMEIS